MTTTTLPRVRASQRLALTNTFTKAVSDRLLLMTLVGLGVGAMCLSMGPMFAALEESIAEMMDALPEAFMAIAAGADMATPAGFYTGEMYSIVAPFALIYVAIASATKAFAGEVEDLTMGPLMANPVRRRWLAIHKLAAMVVHVIGASILIALGTWLGSVVADLDISPANIVAIGVHMALLAIAFGALSMLLSVLTDRRMLSLLVTAGVALVAYLWSSYLPLVESLSGLAGLSPWHHFIGADPLSQGFDVVSLAVLVALATVLAVAGVMLFRRRDIPG